MVAPPARARRQHVRELPATKRLGTGDATFRERQVKTGRMPGWLGAAMVVGAFGTLLWLEHRRPLRRAVEPKARRNLRNLAVGNQRRRAAGRPKAGHRTARATRRAQAMGTAQAVRPAGMGGERKSTRLKYSH